MNFWIPSVIADNAVWTAIACAVVVYLSVMWIFHKIDENNKICLPGRALVAGVILSILFSFLNLVPNNSIVVQWSIDHTARVTDLSVEEGPLIHVGWNDFEIIPDQVCWNGKVLEINEQFNGEYLQEFLVRLSSLKSQGVNGVGFWDLNQSWMNTTWFRPPYINVSESTC